MISTLSSYSPQFKYNGKTNFNGKTKKPENSVPEAQSHAGLITAAVFSLPSILFIKPLMKNGIKNLLPTLLPVYIIIMTIGAGIDYICNSFIQKKYDKIQEDKSKKSEINEK